MTVSGPAEPGMKPLMVNMSNAPSLEGDQHFRAALVGAVLAHMALLALGVNFAVPRQMGEANGQRDGLTVEIIDASQLPGRAAPQAPSSKASVAAVPAEAPAAAVEPVPRQPTAPPEPSLTPMITEPPPAAQAEPKDFQDPDLFALKPPDGTEKAGKAPDGPARKPKKPTADFNLAMPQPQSFQSSNDAPGGNAAMTRPDGITRSGLNDVFGRNVIRALRATMPEYRGSARDVTVRFELSESGNLIDVQIVRTSGDGVLDQDVLFSVKQANFPIPIANSKPQDRVFRVTYIYNR